MLALRFADVDLERGLLTLGGETTKSRKTRVVPISTARLRAVPEWLRLDADGEPKADAALVFSNEVGQPLRVFHRQWQTFVLRAHGHTPTWGASTQLPGGARPARPRIDHDHGTLRQPDRGQPADRSGDARTRADVRAACGQSFKILSRSAPCGRRDSTPFATSRATPQASEDEARCR